MKRDCAVLSYVRNLSRRYQEIDKKIPKNATNMEKTSGNNNKKGKKIKKLEQIKDHGTEGNDQGETHFRYNVRK